MHRVRQFTNVTSWKYLRSKDMIADLGTCRCTCLRGVDKNSACTEGHYWMQEDETKFPCMSVGEIILSSKENEEAKKEVQCEYNPTHGNIYSNKMEKTTPEHIKVIYHNSNYAIDESTRFQKVVRILALIMKFIKNIQHHISM